MVALLSRADRRSSAEKTDDAQQTALRVRSGPVRLDAAVERLEGADDAPMLYDARTRRYVRLTPTGARILDAIERIDSDPAATAPTGDELAERLGGGDRERTRRARSALTTFLGDLWNKGLLEGAPSTATSGISFTPRWEAIKTPERFLGPVARTIGRLPDPLVRLGAAAVWASAAVVLVAMLPAAFTALTVAQIQWLWLLLLLLVVVVHESAHGVVCIRHGIPPRSAGLAMMLYVLPIAYMDRTDSYRLRSRRSRIAISMAGPWVDTVAAATAALVTVTVLEPGSDAQATGAAMTAALVLILVYNLNPLVPSDGYQALESATGLVNLRSRAFRWFGARISGRPVPAESSALSRTSQTGYVIMVILTVAYPVMVIVSLALLITGGASGGAM